MSRPLTLRLTQAAEADLADIWAYLAREASEAVAARVITAIEAACEPLRHFPFAAPERNEFAPGLRVTFHHPYAIYYRPLADSIVIIRVLHGARDAAALARRGGFSE